MYNESRDVRIRDRWAGAGKAFAIACAIVAAFGGGYATHEFAESLGYDKESVNNFTVLGFFATYFALAGLAVLWLPEKISPGYNKRNPGGNGYHDTMI